MNFSKTLFFALFIFSTVTVSAQGMIDGYFKPKGHGSVTASFTQSTFDGFFVGDVKMDGVPVHNEISQQIISVYGMYGLTDRLTAIVSLPYISAQGNGDADPVNGQTEVSGIQDLSLALKYQLFSTTVGQGGFFQGLGALGVSLPGGYEPNGILSIGNGALATDLTVGGHLQTAGGLFVTGTAGYSLRGTADDEIGVINNGEFDVPNALIFMGKIGYGSDKFFASAFIDHQSSTDGIDISDADFGGRFPETKVDYTRAGVSIFYPISRSFGVSANYGTVLSGRNLGDSNFFGGGITYSFGGGK